MVRRQNQSPYSDNEVIDFNTIATQGDAVDFGNLTAGTSMPELLHLLTMEGCKNRSLVLY